MLRLEPWRLLTPYCSVAPKVRLEGLEPLHISPADLLAHLMSTLVGNSSPLYSWDSTNERMALSDKYHNHMVIADGLTEDMSSRQVTKHKDAYTSLINA